MRLLKLAMLGLFGYALYEFIRGMMRDVAMSGMRQGTSVGNGRNRDQRGRFVARSGNGGMNITGPGRGHDESTLETDGGSVRHTVGRGVVSRTA